MKKVYFLVGFIITQFSVNNFAGNEAVSYAAKKAARLALAAAMKIKDNRAAKGILKVVSLKNVNDSLGFASGIVSITATTTLAAKRIRSYFFTNKSDTVKRLLSQQEQDFLVARKSLIDLLNKHANEEIGAYGLPKACDEAVRILVVLPGGQEEFEKIKDIFKKYFCCYKGSQE